MKKANKRFTPDLVTELSDCEVFVYGSRRDRMHRVGAAKAAHDLFGADWDVAEGPTGRCYAIPLTHVRSEDMLPAIDRFVEYARAHPMQRFLLTRIGCGLGEYKDMDMAYLFRSCHEVPNISIPHQWLAGMLIDVTLGIDVPANSDHTPSVIDDHTLVRLCDEHLYEIGAGIRPSNISITMRYVSGRGSFGYAKFGDFFYHDGCYWLWDTDDHWAGVHDQGVVEATFHDQCRDRGYVRPVINAGIETHCTDRHKRHIFTGDVLSVSKRSGLRPHTLALGRLGTGEMASYAFMLDNHSLTISECSSQHWQLTRIGTIFYQLPAEPLAIDVANAAYHFNMNDAFDRGPLKARYTPNFDLEEWEYDALKMIGAEFNWQ